MKNVFGSSRERPIAYVVSRVHHKFDKIGFNTLDEAQRFVASTGGKLRERSKEDAAFCSWSYDNDHQIDQWDRDSFVMNYGGRIVTMDSNYGG